MSIWKGIDRAALERDIAKLWQIDRYQPAPPQTQASSGSKLSTSVDDAFHVFPVSVERQLATDLAVLAAWQPTPACVSAASIHLNPDLDGLVVTLSANEGVASPVQDAFTEILTLLRTCATRCTLTTQTKSTLSTEPFQRCRGRAVQAPAWKSSSSCTGTAY